MGLLKVLHLPYPENRLEILHCKIREMSRNSVYCVGHTVALYVAERLWWVIPSAVRVWVTVMHMVYMPGFPREPQGLGTQ